MKSECPYTATYMCPVNTLKKQLAESEELCDKFAFDAQNERAIADAELEADVVGLEREVDAWKRKCEFYMGLMCFDTKIIDDLKKQIDPFAGG